MDQRFAHSAFTQCTDRYPPDNAKSHVHKSTAHCSGGAQIILELTGVPPHVSLIRVDVALPVDHRLSVVALVGDRIDTSGERTFEPSVPIVFRRPQIIQLIELETYSPCEWGPDGRRLGPTSRRFCPPH